MKILHSEVNLIIYYVILINHIIRTVMQMYILLVYKIHYTTSVSNVISQNVTSYSSKIKLVGKREFVCTVVIESDLLGRLRRFNWCFAQYVTELSRLYLRAMANSIGKLYGARLSSTRNTCYQGSWRNPGACYLKVYLCDFHVQPEIKLGSLLKPTKRLSYILQWTWCQFRSDFFKC